MEECKGSHFNFETRFALILKCENNIMNIDTHKTIEWKSNKNEVLKNQPSYTAVPKKVM